MSDRYEALERLQRLRESGVLTDEEFQAEKRRLLRDDAPQVERVTEIRAGAEPRSRTPLYVLLGAGGLAVAVAVGLLVGRTVGGGHEDDAIVNLAAPAPGEGPSDLNLLQVAPPPPVQDVRLLPKSEQLGRAFAAAFGGAHGQATVQAGGRTLAYRPADILWVGDRAVLISAAAATQDCHGCVGTLAVHYLKGTQDKFEVTGSWLDAVNGAGWGAPPKWRLTGAFTSFPAIYEEGGYAGQGITCRAATLTELAPGGPVRTGPVRLSSDNAGAVPPGQEPVRIEGRIANVKKDASFDVVYAAAQPFTETWVRQGDRFVPPADSKAPQC
jgi:hypothetical protein